MSTLTRAPATPALAALRNAFTAADDPVALAPDEEGGKPDRGRGTGLRGLADRLGALDGSRSLDSPDGSGTTLRGEIPV